MATHNVTIGDFAAECEVVLNQLDPELSYQPADLQGFVRAAWPCDGTPADVACQFANEVRKQRGEK
jgi:hypothetical protein